MTSKEYQTDSPLKSSLSFIYVLVPTFHGSSAPLFLTTKITITEMIVFTPICIVSVEALLCFLQKRKQQRSRKVSCIDLLQSLFLCPSMSHLYHLQKAKNL